MTKPKFGNNIDPSVGKATQFPHNDPTKGGRKPSIRKQLEEVINDNGTYTIDAKDVLKINEDGSVVIRGASAEQMARKLVDWAMSNKGTDSLKAIQMVMEQLDGKPKQTIEQETKNEKVIRVEIIDNAKD